MNEYYGLKHITLNRISFLKHYALKHIVNSLNDGTYYVNINFNVCLHNNNLFHILNVHMLWKKTGVQSVHT